jgi:hypothetical protein
LHISIVVAGLDFAVADANKDGNVDREEYAQLLSWTAAASILRATVSETQPSSREPRQGCPALAFLPARAGSTRRSGPPRISP